jgi:hypothetical protein
MAAEMTITLTLPPEFDFVQLHHWQDHSQLDRWGITIVRHPRSAGQGWSTGFGHSIDRALADAISKSKIEPIRSLGDISDILNDLTI